MNSVSARIQLFHAIDILHALNNLAAIKTVCFEGQIGLIIT